MLDNKTQGISWGLILLVVVLATVAMVIFAIPQGHGPISSNESTAKASLKQYAAGQLLYQNADYASVNGLPPESFAPGYQFLGGDAAHKDARGERLTLVPDAMSTANTPQASYRGYYFIDVKLHAGKPLNTQKEFALIAVPSAYEKTGVRTFLITADGVLKWKDTQGKPISDLAEIDASWGIVD